MVEIPSDTDQTVLYDVNHVIENGMYTPNDYHLSNPNGIQNDAMNILIVSIEKYPSQFEGQRNSGKFDISFQINKLRNNF